MLPSDLPASPAAVALPGLVQLTLAPLLKLAASPGNDPAIAEGLLAVLADLDVQVLRSSSYQGTLDLLADDPRPGAAPSASRTLSPAGGWYKALGPRDQARASDFFLETSRIARMFEQRQADQPGRRFLEKLGAEAAWIDTKIGTGRAAFAYGHVRVFPMPGVSRSTCNPCLSALDSASGFIRACYPQLLYGQVLLTTGLVGQRRSVAGYVESADALVLSQTARATSGDVHALCRAFARRLEARLWKDPGERAAFEALSLKPHHETIGYPLATRQLVAEEFLGLALARLTGLPVNDMSELSSRWMHILSHRDAGSLAKALRALRRDPSVAHRAALLTLISRPGEPDVALGTTKALHAPLLLGAEGDRSWQDNFAEAFALHAMNRPLPSPLAALLSTLTLASSP
jgi:hypothetical protein